MAALGWPCLAIGRDIDLAGRDSRPPDRDDLLNGNVWVQDICQGGHRGVGVMVVFQEKLKGLLQPVGETEHRVELVEVGWMSHHPQQPVMARIGSQHKHCPSQGCWSVVALSGGKGCRSLLALISGQSCCSVVALSGGQGYWSVVVSGGQGCWLMMANASCCPGGIQGHQEPVRQTMVGHKKNLSPLG